MYIRSQISSAAVIPYSQFKFHRITSQIMLSLFSSNKRIIYKTMLLRTLKSNWMRLQDWKRKSRSSMNIEHLFCIHNDRTPHTVQAVGPNNLLWQLSTRCQPTPGNLDSERFLLRGRFEWKYLGDDTNFNAGGANNFGLIGRVPRPDVCDSPAERQLEGLRGRHFESQRRVVELCICDILGTSGAFALAVYASYIESQAAE